MSYQGPQVNSSHSECAKLQAMAKQKAVQLKRWMTLAVRVHTELSEAYTGSLCFETSSRGGKRLRKLPCAGWFAAVSESLSVKVIQTIKSKYCQKNKITS